MNGRLPRIFMGLQEIAGYYGNLKKGFEELGVDALFVDLVHHPFMYRGESDANLWVRMARWVAARRISTPRSHVMRKVWWIGLLQAVKLPLFLWAVTAYDVFIFGFQSTFFGFQELPILKWLGKRIVYVFHGSDSRPPYIDGALMNRDGGVSMETCIELTRKQKATVQRIERHADIIVSYPLSSQLHEKPFVFSALLGIPYVVPEQRRARATPSSASTGVRILHAPSDPQGKGTPRIREAVRKLTARGSRIEYVEVIGQPHAVVVEELIRCDFVVDQLYSDTPMAGFATEAAFFGKPAIVGGYARQEIERIFPREKLPPAHYCHPDEIESAIERLVEDTAYRLELGRRARSFVERNWTPRKVAERFVLVIQGLIPPEWMFNPGDLQYVHGGGLPEARVKQLVRALIEQGGRGALQLGDKPELERKLLELAYS